MISSRNPSKREWNDPLEAPNEVSGDGSKQAAWIALASLLIFAGCIIIVIWTRPRVDYPVMHFLNLFAGKHRSLDGITLYLADNNFTSGIILFSLIWYVWFCSTDPDYRGRILVGALGAALAGITSRLLQLTLPTHLRPLHDLELAFRLPLGVAVDDLNHWNSFPSDHAVVFFGLAAVIFYANAKLGCLAFGWSVVLTAARVYLGYHYPSDGLGGCAFGVLVVSLLQGGKFRSLGIRILPFEGDARPVFYMAAFFVSYQIATLFDDVRELFALPFIKEAFQRLLHH